MFYLVVQQDKNSLLEDDIPRKVGCSIADNTCRYMILDWLQNQNLVFPGRHFVGDKRDVIITIIASGHFKTQTHGDVNRLNEVWIEPFIGNLSARSFHAFV